MPQCLLCARHGSHCLAQAVGLLCAVTLGHCRAQAVGLVVQAELLAAEAAQISTGEEGTDAPPRGGDGEQTETV